MTSPVLALTEVATFTILSGAALSAAVHVGNRIPVGLIMPAAWTAASVTFQTSWDNSTFYDIYDVLGAEVSITTAAGRFVALDYLNLLGVGPYIKVRSGTTGTAVNQGADRTVLLSVARPAI